MPRWYGETGNQQYASAPAVGAAGATYYNTTDATLYLSNGTAWIPVTAGDTGWLACTITAAGWTNNSPLSARQIGSVVYFRGIMTNAAFTNSAHVALGTLPAAIGKPGVSSLFPIPCYGATAIIRSFQVTTAGDINISSNIANGTQYQFTTSYAI